MLQTVRRHPRPGLRPSWRRRPARRTRFDDTAVGPVRVGPSILGPRTKAAPADQQMPSLQAGVPPAAQRDPALTGERGIGAQIGVRITDLLDLTDARRHEPSIRLERVPGPVGSLRLRPAVRWPYADEWTPGPPVSAWTPDDIARAAAWFARHSAPDEPVSTKGVWFASPGGRVPGHRP
jgi:hypothetical protein